MATAGTAPTELGDKRIRDLFMQYAVPAIIAMTASSLYNMVDSIYIGHIKDVGSYAISGLAVTFPLMNLATALGTLVGVGASTILSMLLGQRNYKAANKVLLNEVLLNIIIGLAFSVVTLSFLDPILMFFGASRNTLPFARDYMVIILLGHVITDLYFGLNNMVRASGNPKLDSGSVRQYYRSPFPRFSIFLDNSYIFIFFFREMPCGHCGDSRHSHHCGIFQ